MGGQSAAKRPRSVALIRLSAVLVIASLVATSNVAAADDPVAVADELGADIEWLRDKPTDGLASGELSELASSGTAGLRSAGAVLVEVHHDGVTARVESAVARSGGEVVGAVESELVLARIPATELAAVEAHPEVRYLAPPRMSVALGPDRWPTAAAGLSGAATGQHIAESRAHDWHAEGFDGSGVRIGIVDGFGRTSWNNAQSSGDVPPPSGTFCRIGGSNCDLFGVTTSQHGVNVAEVVHDMAPGADLYVATAATAADLDTAVDWFVANDVDIVTRSMTAPYDGPGDGTGPLASVIEAAVDAGIAWFNAAGNSAGGDGIGSYWRGGFVDADNDGWLEFAPGDETLGFVCGYMNGVRWNDWDDPNATDYDVVVLDTNLNTISTSVNAQPAADPVERPTTCGTPGTIVSLAIRLHAANGGTSGDVLEFMGNQSAFEHAQDPYSASGPGADSNREGAMAVGAIDPTPGNTIAFYSARGPSNDGRTKPDMAAQSCLRTTLTSCFDGTSAASPVLAGAAALVLHSGEATTPVQITRYLRDNAAVDRGGSGWDNTYGAGELRLPSPPIEIAAPSAPQSVEAVAGERRATVSWRAPADDGGDDAFTYRVTGSPSGSCQATAPDTSCVVTGLTSGRSYTFRVTATNRGGTSPNSAASNAVSPTGPTEVIGTQECRRDISPFLDTSTSFAESHIACVYNLGIANGTSPWTFEPTGVVSREQMAAFLARSMRLLGATCPNSTLPFRDATRSFAAADIACVYALGIANGTSATTFDPTGVVTREQMSAFLARVVRYFDTDCPSSGTSFVDIDRSFAAADIACIHALGIANGTTPYFFDPSGVVTRAQMAAFLARMLTGN